ncbi:MAG: hypothetical protein RR603_02640 [Kurthia sp.]
MSRKMEVCCQCYYTGVKSGQLPEDVWCPRCEEWISRSLLLPKDEVLRLRKEKQKADKSNF